MNVICFHNPDEENGYLSNWYLSHFTVNGIDFSSMEQFMMYQKACRFHDEKIANDILHTDNVAEIKKLGRKVHAYDENVWNGVRQLIVYEGLKAKFSQNAELKQKLVDTGDAVLAECAVSLYLKMDTTLSISLIPFLTSLRKDKYKDAFFKIRINSYSYN